MIERREHCRFAAEARDALGIERHGVGKTFSATSRCSFRSRAR
jgi:hypothetical protein